MTLRYLGLVILFYGCAASIPNATPSTEPIAQSSLVESEQQPASVDTSAILTHLEGTVRYQARTPTTKGASRTFELKPARLVDVIALNAAGQEIAHGHTDLSGLFTINATDNIAKIRVKTKIHVDGYELWVSPSALGVGEYEIEANITNSQINLIAYDAAPRGEAGAFHILDTILLGSQTVRSWIGGTLPSCYVYWGRGVTTSWSYFHGQQRQGAYSIELLGGQPGEQSSTDTDEHDESIILHEFGHFVFNVLTTDSSPGGTHSGSILVEPGLAWEEGRATWFSGAVLRSARYMDTIGLEPTGDLRVNVNMEERKNGTRGIGSEEEVEEVLWDLYDGSDGVIDTDNDGIALTANQLLRAMISLRQDESAYPCISTFLIALTNQGLTTQETMIAWLTRQSHSLDLFPQQEADIWPLSLSLGQSVRGKIDALSNPAPSGGPPQPGNGVDAVRVYRVHVENNGYLEVDLRIMGTGLQQDHSDIDLELRTIRTDLMASSTKQENHEHIGMHVTRGWYIIAVRDGGGAGSRANYTLSTRWAP